MVQPVLTPGKCVTPWSNWALNPPLTILDNSQGLAWAFQRQTWANTSYWSHGGGGVRGAVCRVRTGNRSQKMITGAGTVEVPPRQPIHSPVNWSWSAVALEFGLNPPWKEGWDEKGWDDMHRGIQCSYTELLAPQP